MNELEKMRETMERMEQERAEMVAEIESQIERALASMTIGMDESEYGSSRPSSRLSSASQPRSRRASDAGKARHMRSFGTESTLAESVEEDDLPLVTKHSINDVIEEEAELPSPKKKRFSSFGVDNTQDGMHAVDEGITEKSERIAQKVLEIQQKVRAVREAFDLSYQTSKLETALATDRVAQWKNQTSIPDSEDELSESTHTRPLPRRSAARSKVQSRKRSGTASSTQTNTTPRVSEDSSGTPVRRPLAIKSDVATPRTSLSDHRDGDSTPEATAPKSRYPLTPSSTNDGSDTDFQSAYSVEPYNSEDEESLNDLPAGNDLPNDFGNHSKPLRERVSSVSTTIAVNHNN